MSKSMPMAVLAVPNLQGERFRCEIEYSRFDWVKSETSLGRQVETLRREYNGQQLLIGTSFGGLSVWRFTTEQSPTDLKGVILIDVLPTLDAFPTGRSLGFSVLHRLPNRIAQSIYNLYRGYQKQSPVQVKDVLLRVRSLQKTFPHPCFPIPTLVVSSNQNFHTVWKEIARGHDLLTAQERTTLSVQVARWIEELDIDRAPTL